MTKNKDDYAKYMTAMLNSDWHICEAIEREYGVWGLPPQHVSTAICDYWEE